MLTSNILILILIPFVLGITLTEDVYLTKQLMKIFGDNFANDESDDVTSNESDNKLTSGDNGKMASLLSPLDTKERADHYWTRRGHRYPTGTTVQYGWDYYYYNFPPNSNQEYGKRIKRNEDDATLMKDKQNLTSELPQPVFDQRLRKGL